MFKAKLRVRQAASCLPFLHKLRTTGVSRTYTPLVQSLTQGPSHPPLLEQTVGQNFANIVSAYGDRPAYVLARIAQVWDADCSARPAVQSHLTSSEYALGLQVFG